MTYHPKGWKRVKRGNQTQGYVKSHDAVKNGSNRRMQNVVELTSEQHIERGWKPAPADTMTAKEKHDAMVAYLKDLKATTGGIVFLPPVVNPDGTIENIAQFTTVSDGPEEGHWANVNGKRVWMKGQHNYVRQQDPRTHEHVNESKVMNRNGRAVMLGDRKTNRFTGQHYTRPSKELESEARISRYGRTVHMCKAPGFDGMIEKAVARAAKHIENKTAEIIAADTLAPVKPIEAQVQGGAGNTNDSAIPRVA
jgi:hypothetical protein